MLDSLSHTAGIISTVDGIYRNPATGDTLSLDDAVRHGLIAGEILDTKRKTEEKILDSTNIVAHTMNGNDDRYSDESHESTLHVRTIRPPHLCIVYYPGMLTM